MDAEMIVKSPEQDNFDYDTVNKLFNEYREIKKWTEYSFKYVKKMEDFLESLAIETLALTAPHPSYLRIRLESALEDGERTIEEVEKMVQDSRNKIEKSIMP